MNARSYLLLLLLLFTIVSCAIVRTWPYHNQQAQGSVQPTRANYVVGDKERKDGMFVGLALSGGGSRAANFSSAVMLELKKRGILDHVDFISSVSGGSLPAAYYALDGYEYATLGGREKIAFEEAEIKDRMGRNFQQRWLLSWLNPLHILRYWFTDYTRSDIMVPVFDSNLFHSATYANLNPERPKLLINATDSGMFERFTFSDESAERLRTDLSSFSIARAVNVSSAFPGAFQTVTVQDYSQTDTYRHLYDGGPADNLGLDALAEVLFRAVCEGEVPPSGVQQSIMQQSSSARGKCPSGGVPKRLRSIFRDGCLVISIDAAMRSADRDAHRASARRWSDYIVDSNALNATDVMLLNDRKSTLEEFGITKQHIDAKEAEGRLSSFSVVASENECEFWHIALRQIPLDDDLGKQVHNIETSFNIEYDEQKALFDAAKRLVVEGLSAIQERRGEQEKAIKMLLLQPPIKRK